MIHFFFIKAKFHISPDYDKSVRTAGLLVKQAKAGNVWKGGGERQLDNLRDTEVCHRSRFQYYTQWLVKKSMITSVDPVNEQQLLRNKIDFDLEMRTEQHSLSPTSLLTPHT